jgi:hypothetical protein
MKSYWIREDPKYKMAVVFIKRGEILRHTEGRWLCKNRGINWSDKTIAKNAKN